MKIASLFTGVGGVEQGFSRVWPHAEHVAFAEFAPDPSRVLAVRYPKVKNWGDVTNIDWSLFPKCDILHASPPCQNFSVAGKRQGMDGDRGAPLWEALYKCLEIVHPPIFTLEEVQGLLSINGGETWKTIIQRIESIGYHFKWTKLNALDYGIPQSRKRVIGVGFLDKTQCDAFEWPTPQPRIKKLRDILQPEEEVDVRYYLKDGQVLKLLAKMSDEQISRLLTLSAYSQPLKFLDRNQKVLPEYGLCLDTAGTNGVGDDEVRIAVVNGGVHQDYRIYSTEGASPTLASNRGGGSAAHPMIVCQSADGKPYVQIGDKTLAIRKLTVIETSRLMNWPDDWLDIEYPAPTKKDPSKMKHMSNSSKYKMCGNGVVSAVFEALAKQLDKLPTPS